MRKHAGREGMCEHGQNRAHGRTYGYKNDYMGTRFTRVYVCLQDSMVAYTNIYTCKHICYCMLVIQICLHVYMYVYRTQWSDVWNQMRVEVSDAVCADRRVHECLDMCAGHN